MDIGKRPELRCGGIAVNRDGVDHHLDVLVGSKARFLQFLERRLGNRTDAKDVLQAAFLKLAAHEDSLRGEDKLVPWFYQLLRNLIVDHYHHRDAVTRLEQSVAAEAASATTGVDEALFTAVCACVDEIVSALRLIFDSALSYPQVGLQGFPALRSLPTRVPAKM
jgi:RNA polymerase sigma-70 factor (ECF subfamily)